MGTDYTARRARPKRVQYTPPPSIGTFQQDGRTYVTHRDAMRLVAQIADQDKELLERLAQWG